MKDGDVVDLIENFEAGEVVSFDDSKQSFN